MVIHKFGGTSVAGADRYLNVVQILKKLPKTSSGNCAVVVSAMSKVTDSLLQLTDLARQRDDLYQTKMQELEKRHIMCVESLPIAGDTKRLTEVFKKDFSEIADILRGVYLSRACSEQTSELISGFGEIWSAQILNALLNHSGVPSQWLDAREVLVVEPFARSVAVDWAQSEKKSQAWFAKNKSAMTVITGFVASTKDGVATTLKRNGSDFSASIFGRLLKADEIVIWTDVDGVMSADPRLVPDAVVIPEMSYAEATELAYFGAKVVHPDTMGPAIKDKIPIWIKNTFNSDYPGSKISAKITAEPPVKGFATIDDMCLLNVEGTGMVGVPGVSERLFGALKEIGVSVVMISQASSEQSICVAVPQTQGVEAQKAVEKEFAAEILRGEIQNITAVNECSVLAMVGDGMAQMPGTAGRLFTALGRTRANVLAIAQGSSERNISTVVSKKDIHRAVRAAHSAFFLSNQTISVGVIGAGVVGATFLNQLAARAESLKKERGIDIRLRGICNSKVMATNETGLPVTEWRKAIDDAKSPSDINAFAKFIGESHYPHQVLIDLTASQATTDQYQNWLDQGLHIVTANKKAGSGDFQRYTNLLGSARKNNRYFMYETTVGAGLPVLRSLRDLIETGDELIEIEGILSGTLSFLFNNYNGSEAFSEVVKRAKDKGYTEPDPRDDLSGTDVARKLVILAREANLPGKMESVKIDSLVPTELSKISAEDFMKRLTELDAPMLARFLEAQKSGCVLRYVGRVNNKGEASVSLKTVPKDHPLARASGSDNILLFRTKRYDQQPMVIQGPGAGPDVTAAGVFAELLRLSTYLGAPQ